VFEWVSIDPKWLLSEIVKGFIDPKCVRVKPDVILINDHEVPYPCREALKVGTEYWYVALATSNNPVVHAYWDDDSFDEVALSRGVVHLTKGAALKHAEALLSFTKKA
jgi:hypothetical protein